MVMSALSGGGVVDSAFRRRGCWRRSGRGLVVGVVLLPAASVLEDVKPGGRGAGFHGLAGFLAAEAGVEVEGLEIVPLSAESGDDVKAHKK